MTIANRNDVAKRAKVSGTTVSRVYNSPHLVSPEVREKVLKAAEELNYHPNKIARNFVKGISGNVGVIVPYLKGVQRILGQYFISELLSGIGEALNEDGYDLVLFFHRQEPTEENDYTRYFVNGKVDGCIFLGAVNNDQGLRRLAETEYKFCMIENYLEGTDISFIDLDNVKGGYLAVKHLIDLGHRDIAYVNGPLNYTNSLDRYEGYKKALQEHALPFREELVFQGDFSLNGGRRIAAELLKMKNPPTAVFTANDNMAAGLIQGLKDQGIRVPDDIAIVGFDDSDVATSIEPSLTTVRNPYFELGARCAKEFVKELNQEREKGFKIFLEPELIIRNSTMAVKSI